MPMTLLDYETQSPFGGIIGRPRNLAWPVNAYRVTLPKILDNGYGLNPFEQVVLKIIDTGGNWDADSLEKEVCIPKSLVQGILLRLHDKMFIDEYNHITEEGRSKWASKEEKEPLYTTALLFRELATGKILPFMHIFDEENPLKKKEEEKRYRQIHHSDNNRYNSPNPHDVIIVLRSMIKRSKAFGANMRIPAVQQINIAKEPELYYLDCPIAIQKNDADFRIANPFGNGFSLVLEKSFEYLLEQDDSLKDWFKTWNQNLSNSDFNKQDSEIKEPFDNAANMKRYSQLVANLRIIRNRQNRLIEQIYSALEWALFYTCTQRPYNNVVSQLKLTKRTEHSALLKKTAEKIGLSWPPQYDFYSVRKGKIEDFLSGKADLMTVLSIALLMAENDTCHPINNIALKHPSFISILFDIKKKRDDPGHGKGKIQKKDIKLSEESFMQEIVTTLLPDIYFSDIPITTADKDLDSDLMLGARINIQNEFGFQQFNHLVTNIQDRLIYAEKFKLSWKEQDNATPFVWDLYAVLQAMFRIKLVGALPPEILESNFISSAQDKAKKAGLGEMTKALTTVKPEIIRKTLQGNDQSLGACVVVFLLVLDEDDLREVADIQPSFFSDITNIITRRGHGNEQLSLSADEINKLRKQTFITIKTLLEV